MSEEAPAPQPADAKDKPAAEPPVLGEFSDSLHVTDQPEAMREIARRAGPDAQFGVGRPIPIIGKEEDFTLPNVMRASIVVFTNREIRLCFLQAETSRLCEEMVGAEGKERTKLRAEVRKLYKDIKDLESSLGESLEQIVVIRKGSGHAIGAVGEMLPREAKIIEAADARIRIEDEGGRKAPKRQPYAFRPSTAAKNVAPTPPRVANAQFRDGPSTQERSSTGP